MVRMLASIILLVCCIYAPSLWCGFVFDDASAIVGNADVSSSSKTNFANLLLHDFWGSPLVAEGSHKSYRPITTLSFRLSAVVHGGLNAALFHAHNIVLYVAVTLAFYRWLVTLEYPVCLIKGDEQSLAKSVFRCRNTRSRTLLATVLFAVHPIHTEAVVSLVGRAELLAGLWMLLGLLLAAPDHSAQHGILKTLFQYITLLILTILATFSKEQGFTLIPVLVVFWILDFLAKLVCVNNSSRQAASASSESHRPSLVVFVLVIAFYICIALLVLWIRIMALHGSLPTFSIFDNPAAHASWKIRLLTHSWLPVLNFWLLLLPDQLCADWSMGTVPLISSVADGRVLVSVIFYVLIFSVGLYWMGKLYRGQLDDLFCLKALSFMVITFLPASNLLFPVGFVLAERVLFLPSMGFCMLVAQGCHNLMVKRPTRSVPYQFAAKCLTAGVIAAFGAKTFSRCFDWRNDHTLFLAATRVTWENAKVFNNIGHYLEAKNRTKDALGYFHKAARVQPDDVGAWINVGRALEGLGRDSEAEMAWITGKTYMPAIQPGRNYTTMISPSHLYLYINLARFYRKHGNLVEAEASLRGLLSMRPSFIPGILNLGDLLISQDRSREAILLYKKALANPALLDTASRVDVMYNLGLIYCRGAMFGRAKIAGSPGSTSDSRQSSADTAWNIFNDAFKLNPDHVRSLIQCAVLSVTWKGNKTLSFSLISRAVGINPQDSAEMLAHMAILCYDAGELGFASSIYEVAFATPILEGLFPRSCWYNYAIVAAELRRPEEALTILSKTLQIYPDYLRARLFSCQMMGSLSNRTGGYPAKMIQKCYDQVLRQDNSNVVALHNLCILLLNDGPDRLEAAKHCVAQAAKLVGSNSSHYTNKHLNILENRLKNVLKHRVN